MKRNESEFLAMYQCSDVRPLPGMKSMNEKTNYICVDGKYCVYGALHRRENVEFTFSSALIVPSNKFLVCFRNSTRSLKSDVNKKSDCQSSILYYFEFSAISYFYGVPCWLLEKICH